MLNNKFNEGDTVFEISRPQHLMLVTKRNGIVYYCQPIQDINNRVAAFMERDLKRFLVNPEVAEVE